MCMRYVGVRCPHGDLLTRERLFRVWLARDKGERGERKRPLWRGREGLLEDPETHVVVNEGLVAGRLLYAAKRHLGTEQPAGGQVPLLAHRIVDERVVVLQEAPMPSWARVVQTANWAIPVACSDQMGKLSA